MRIASLGWLVLVAGCGGPLSYKIASSPLAPGADATIKAGIAKDQHLTHLNVDALHLAPPDRLTNAARIFILWSRRSPDQQWARIGNLKYDAGGREGLFEGTVPEIEFDFQITVEKDDTAQSPSPQTVFSQHIGPG